MMSSAMLRVYRRRVARMLSRSPKASAFVTISLVLVAARAIVQYRYPACDDDEAKAFIEDLVRDMHMFGWFLGLHLHDNIIHVCAEILWSAKFERLVTSH